MAVLIQGVLISCQITKAHYKLEVVERSVIKEGYQRRRPCSRGSSLIES